MGVSENSVPLNPMVNDHYISLLNGYNWEYTVFSNKPILRFFGYYGMTLSIYNPFLELHLQYMLVISKAIGSMYGIYIYANIWGTVY